MQFLILAYDGTDSEAINRRMAARPAHVALGDKHAAQGQLLYATAILDESEKMIGSMMITEFANLEDLDKWLAIEPYVTGKVWEKIEIQPCKVGARFEKSAV